MKKLQEILNKENIELPNSYLEYLQSDDFQSEIMIFKDEDAFRLYTLEELFKESNIDGQKLLQIQELKGYIDTILEVNDDFFDDEDKREYQEIAKYPAIGYQNTAVLCFNPKNYQLYVFHPDGGDYEKVKKTKLTDIIKQ